MKKIVAIAISAMLLVLCLAVTAGAAEYVYYENDFSDAGTMSDFTQYRGEWGVVDGQLMLTGLGTVDMGGQAWILYTKDEGIMNLTDYILEVDMYGTQTQAGPLFRCDLNNLFPDMENGFCGYQAFISLTGEKGAIGRGNLIGNWAGNLIVSEKVTTPGSNLHLKITAEGTKITYVLSDIDSGAELWNTTIENDEFALGTFGFRGIIMSNGLTNVQTVGFDNLKVTAIGEVGDHLAAGGTLSTYVPKVTSMAVKPEVTPAIEVTVPDVVEVDASALDMTATEYVFYENDFSDAATLADFTQYRGKWAIKDGKLYYDALSAGFDATGNLSFILYTANHDANLLRNYTVELDIINSQSAAGIITHADLSKACSDGGNAFYGYLSFVSNNGKLAAIGRGNAEGGWAGNITVSEELLAPGSDYHLKVEHNDGVMKYTISAVGSDEAIFSYECEAYDWMNGSFGIRSISTKDTLTNLGTVGFDNMKVTVYGNEAVLLNAGYHPNAAIIEGTDTPAAGTDTPDVTGEPVVTADVTGETETTDESVVTTTEPVAAPEVTTEPANTDEPEQTTAPVTTTPAEDGGAPVGLLVGIVAAVVVIAVVVLVLLKKKKN